MILLHVKIEPNVKKKILHLKIATLTMTKKINDKANPRFPLI